ncbi:MAG: ABC transporter ATP-binding protein [Pseudomonadota bacterium]
MSDDKVALAETDGASGDVIRVGDVWKSYGASSPAVLKGVSLSVAKGETVALTGESGCGKSTLLHLIAGLDRFDRGDITVLGQSLSEKKDSELAYLRIQSVSVVFQQFNLIPSLNVFDNLAFQARLAGSYKRKEVLDLAERLGVNDVINALPENLSGGQQQRVAIGRAVAAKPQVLLADEPTGNLDERNTDDVIDLITDLVDATGASLLLVTHSPKLAARLDRQIELVEGVIR